jgi:WD40 repeat protein
MKTSPNVNRVIVLSLTIFIVCGGLSRSAAAQTASGPELLIQDGHSYAVNSVAFSPDGMMLVSAAADDSVELWDLRVGRLIRSFQGHRAAVNSVAFSPDGKTVASASNDKTIKLWGVGAGQLIRTIEGHIDKVNSVAFSPNGRMLASGGADSLVNLWDQH